MPGLKSSDNDKTDVSAGAICRAAPMPAATTTARSVVFTTARATSELEPYRELGLTRRRVDVAEQRCARTKQRPAGRRVVARADVPVRRVEVRAVEDVQQLRDEFGALRSGEPKRLRQTQVDIGEPWTIDRR